jgi:hypothetical protein
LSAPLWRILEPRARGSVDASEPERHQGAQGEAECDCERHAGEGQGGVVHLQPQRTIAD